ncbi:MAG: chaperonin GroEL [Planctomycetota bacterium]|nr:chaperonin GroEL [Planctomycetota bacterium]
MTAKQLAFDQEAREKIRSGVQKLARAVKVTYGPRGRNAVIDKGWGSPNITKDGVTVAEEVELSDAYEDMGAQLVKEAATKTSDVAGDGTTTATVLAEAIYLQAHKYVAAGAGTAALARGIRSATEAAVEALGKLAQKVSADPKQVSQVAAIAANGDKEIGKMIASAMDKVGKDGVITIEEGKTLDTKVSTTDGMQFDRGFLSPHFVTDPERMECVLEGPWILVWEDKISSAAKLVPLLEAVSKTGRALCIIAEDIDGDALATLVLNKLRGVVQTVAVKAPGYGDRRKQMLEDLGILTGARPLFKDLGVELERVSLEDLGTCRRITVSNDNTVIVDGAGTQKAIEARIAQIRREIDATDSDYDREKMQERLARLAGGVAQIEVGAATETEMKEKKARVEDALHATRAAVEEGILPGGGTAFVRAEKAIQKLLKDDALEGDERLGVQVVFDALQVPLRTLADNAGFEGHVVLRNVRKAAKATGFDANSGELVDMYEAGIVDPTKVARSALQNASSVAALLMSTDALVANLPEDDDDHDHDMGDDF